MREKAKIDDDDRKQLLKDNYCLKAEDLMVQRQEISAIQIDTPINEICDIFLESKQSSLLVYRDNLDDIVGTLDIYQILNFIYKNVELDFKNLKEVLFITENTDLSYLLSIMMQKDIQIAAIVDEFGSTKGVITYESLAQNLYKNLFFEKILTESKEGGVIVEGTTLLSSLQKFLLPETIENSESNTIGGFLAEHLGKIPQKGEKLQIDNCEFYVTESDDRVVKKIAVKILN